MEEPTLDNATRLAILSQLVEKKTPKVTTPTPDHTYREPAKEAVIETTVAKKIVCKNCGHKIWNDGEEWQHSGKEHDANCDCRQASPTAAEGEAIVRPTTKVGESKQFDSTTPVSELLEAVIANKVNEAKQDEEEAKVHDITRRKILEKIHGQGDALIQNWRF